MPRPLSLQPGLRHGLRRQIACVLIGLQLLLALAGGLLPALARAAALGETGAPALAAMGDMGEFCVVAMATDRSSAADTGAATPARPADVPAGHPSASGACAICCACVSTPVLADTTDHALPIQPVLSGLALPTRPDTVRSSAPLRHTAARAPPAPTAA